MPPIAFQEQHIHVLADAAGEPIRDIRTQRDNTLAADFITDRVRALTEDPHSALHVSIAGGRKTMGFYVGYALSLYGRRQDRLSHVLVNPPFESQPGFFYPSPESELILVNGRPYDKRDAEVTLADIPFVRMRDGLSERLLAGQASFSETVDAAQRALPPTELVLDPEQCMVTAAGETFAMPPSRFALYWLMATRALTEEPGLHWAEDQTTRDFLALYAQLVNPLSGRYEAAEEAFGETHLTKENFDPTKSHINRELKKRLGERRAAPYRVRKLGPYIGRYSRFGLKLRPDAIRIISEND